MNQEKSPFEEIFKKEEKRKEKKEKEDKGILGAIDREETAILQESTVREIKEEEVEIEASTEKDRYQSLIKELLRNDYFEEAISVIHKMKEKYGK